MRAFRVLACIAVIALFVGIAVVGDAQAGEKFKVRTVKQSVKWEQIEVGDQEGHIIAISEAKGISTNMEGKWFADGWVQHYVALGDFNPKTGIIVAHGYEQRTAPDGGKVCYQYEGKQIRKDYWEGTYIILSGTGKFEGIRGKGIWTVHVVAPGQWYSDEDWDIELPKR
jgi:hypothetical protein